MLSIFLCTGRTAIDDDIYSSFTVVEPAGVAHPPSQSRKKSLRLMGNSSKKPAKMEISAPFGFKHETHMGYDEIAGIDVDRYQREMEAKLAEMQLAQAAAPSASYPQTTLNRHRSSSVSTSGSPSSSPPRPIRRKPVPSALMSPSSSGGSNEVSPMSAVFPDARSSSAGPGIQKSLVPLLGGKGATSNSPYVTQTAKIRWDGAMAEIEKALKEEPRRF